MKIHISDDSTMTEIEYARDQQIDPYWLISVCGSWELMRGSS
jgi:hypothetical protein